MFAILSIIVVVFISKFYDHRIIMWWNKVSLHLRCFVIVSRFIYWRWRWWWWWWWWWWWRHDNRGANYNSIRRLWNLLLLLTRLFSFRSIPPGALHAPLLHHGCSSYRLAWWRGRWWCNRGANYKFVSSRNFTMIKKMANKCHHKLDSVFRRKIDI